MNNWQKISRDSKGVVFVIIGVPEASNKLMFVKKTDKFFFQPALTLLSRLKKEGKGGGHFSRGSENSLKLKNGKCYEHQTFELFTI